MPDWFTQNAPKDTGGDWFAKNAPPSAAPAAESHPVSDFLGNLGNSLKRQYESMSTAPDMSPVGLLRSAAGPAVPMIENAAHGIANAYHDITDPQGGSFGYRALTAGGDVLAGIVPNGEEFKRAGQQIGSGDIAGGFGTAVGGATPMLAAKGTEAAPEIAAAAKGAARGIKEAVPNIKYGKSVVPAVVAEALGKLTGFHELNYATGAAASVALDLIKAGYNGAKAEFASKNPPNVISEELQRAASGTPTPQAPPAPEPYAIPVELQRAASGTPNPPVAQAPQPVASQPTPAAAAPSLAPSPAPVSQGPSIADQQLELLNGLAQGQGFKSFAKVPDADKPTFLILARHIAPELATGEQVAPSAKLVQSTPAPTPADYIYQGPVPERVYHGTNRDFSEFDQSKATNGENAQLGTHFSEDPEFANRYAVTDSGSGPRRGDQPNVRPAQLDVKKPLDLDAFAKANPGKAANLTADDIRQMGYDAATRVEPMTQMRRTWIALDPAQIKSPWQEQATAPSTPLPNYLKEVSPTDKGGIPPAQIAQARTTIANGIAKLLNDSGMTADQLQGVEKNSNARMNLEKLARVFSKQGDSYRMSDDTVAAIRDALTSLEKSKTAKPQAQPQPTRLSAPLRVLQEKGLMPSARNLADLMNQ